MAKSTPMKPPEELIREVAEGFTARVSMQTRVGMIEYLRAYAVVSYQPAPVPEKTTREIDGLERKWTAN